MPRTVDDILREIEAFRPSDGDWLPLDDLLSDEVMVPVLLSAGYEPDEFREMMTEMALNLATP